MSSTHARTANRHHDRAMRLLVGSMRDFWMPDTPLLALPLPEAADDEEEEDNEEDNIEVYFDVTFPFAFDCDRQTIRR